MADNGELETKSIRKVKQEYILYRLQHCHLVLVTTVVLEIDHLYVLHIFVVHLELQAPMLDQPQS